MRITALNLYTDNLEANKEFFLKKLGLEPISVSRDRFTVRIGWSELSFSKSELPHTYHYCFLIPRNRLEKALEWMGDRTQILEIEVGKHTQHFDSWNADSFYFLDGSGNLAECIARHDLPFSEEGEFSRAELLCLNEIGMPTRDIPKTDKTLSGLLGTGRWKGDQSRFGTHGDEEGLFLLPNYQVKKTWFPTGQKIIPEPFQATVEHQGRKVSVEFKNELLKIKKE